MVAATTEPMAPPDRGVRYFIKNQNRWSGAMLAAGIAAMAFLLVGTLAVLTSHGWTQECPPDTTRLECAPSDPLAQGITSTGLGVVLRLSVVAGLVVAAAGALSYRRMPKKPSREAVLAGAMLALQAAVLALIVLWFRGTDVGQFARNFLNVRLLGDRAGVVLSAIDDRLLSILRLAAIWGVVAAGASAVWVRFRHSSARAILYGGLLGVALGAVWGVLDVAPAGTFAKGAQNTLILSATGATLGFVLGLIIALFAMSKRAVVRAPARVYINFFRGTPLIWQISFAGIGLAPALRLNLSMYTIAILVLGLNLAAYSAEVYRAGIQSLERGQIEGSRALGLGYMQSMRYVIIPQAIQRVIPPLLNEFVILIKDTALVSVLGLTLAQRELLGVGRGIYSATFDATAWLGSAAGYLIITIPLIRVVTVVERRLRSGLTSVIG